MPVIRSALRDHRDLGARGSSHVCVRIRRGDPKLFDRLRSRSKNGILRGLELFSPSAILLVVDINTVEEHVRLIASSAGYIALPCNTGLQGQKVSYATKV